MNAQRKCLAFTLVEMLVVIAIICVLSTLLLPALRNAKDMARTTACAGNQKQIGVAFSMYVSDYNGWCPPMKTSNNLWWYMEQILGSALGGGASTPIDISGTALFCPADTRKVSCDWHDVDYPDRYVIVGYPNYGVCSPDPWTPTKQIKLSQIPTPSEKVFLADNGNYYASYPYINWNGIMVRGCAKTLAQIAASTNLWTAVPLARHRDQFNAVYIDGHVQREKYFGGGVVEKYTKFKYEATSAW